MPGSSSLFAPRRAVPPAKMPMYGGSTGGVPPAKMPMYGGTQDFSHLPKPDAGFRWQHMAPPTDGMAQKLVLRYQQVPDSTPMGLETTPWQPQPQPQTTGQFNPNGPVGMPPLRGVSGASPLDYQQIPRAEVSSAAIPQLSHGGPPVYQPSYGRSPWAGLSAAQIHPPTDLQRSAASGARSAAEIANQEGGVFRGIDPSRIFGDPQLASEVTGDTYLGMRNAKMQGDQTAATTGRNIGVFGQMGQPNPVGEQADRIIAGGPINQPLGPVGGLYGNTPLAGAPMVNPRMGQTLQGAQQAYQGAMANATADTQRRMGEMFTDPALGGQYQRTPLRRPLEDGSVPIGLMKSTVKGQAPNTIIRRPDGSTLIQGAVSTEEWGNRKSTLPGAEGRTNAEMAAVARGNARDYRQSKRDSRAVGLVNRALGQAPPAAYLGARRLGVPLAGRGGYKPGATATGEGDLPQPQTVGEAMKALGSAAQDPVFAQMDENFDPRTATANDWSAFIQNPDLAGLSPTDLRTIQGGLRAAQSNGMNLKPGSNDLELFKAFESGGPGAVKKLLEDRTAAEQRKRDSSANSVRRQPPVWWGSGKL